MLLATLFSSFFLFINQDIVSAKIACKDENGKTVDWFIIYKMPELHDSSIPLVKEGLGHFYMDVNSQSWKLSAQSLNGSQHAIYYTLQQLYNNAASKDVAYILYDDETPAGHKALDYGHTKGDIVFDKATGFWLVHSVPRFPPSVGSRYSWPPSALRYGQSFLCVSYSYKYLNIIGKQLLYNNPWIWNFSIPDAFKENTYLVDAVKKKHVGSAPWNNSVPLVSLHGQRFISFAKYKKFNQDLYSTWVAPTLGSSLNVESWQNGRGKLPSNCTGQYKVQNVEKIQIGAVSFEETHDHSKWAVTTDPNKKWTCIGDINRQSSQQRRSGGTVCVNLPKVWQAFTSIVAGVAKC